MERFPIIGTVNPVQSSDIRASSIGLGFEKLDRDVFDPSKAYDKVAAAGVKWARIQSGWARTEKEKGRYDFAWLDDVVDNLLRRGIRPWICLCYGNGLYDENAAKVFGAVGVPPIFTEEQRKAWHDYVVATVSHYRGRVDHYEIWNEPDGCWCWKHGPNGTEYGNFMIATAKAIREADPAAKTIGGVICMRESSVWFHEALATGAGPYLDFVSYHAYDFDERVHDDRIDALRALCSRFNPKIRLIQGETGTQSRSDGAGANSGQAWTALKQAKFLARLLVHDLGHELPLTSYFSCMDMIEALNGTVGDKASYMDYGYFGVLGADFDAEGRATGGYTPKPSYRALQTIAALFRDGVEHGPVPVQFYYEGCARLGWVSGQSNAEPTPPELMRFGFNHPNGAVGCAYWKSVNLLTETYESTVGFIATAVPEKIRLVNLLDGTVHSVPDKFVERTRFGVRLHHLPVLDSPLLLSFGDFV